MLKLTDRIYAWVDGVPFDGAAIEQVRRLTELDFVKGHVAVMPDVHAGKGSTIGTVFVTQDAIIPAAVGVDIGCGMIAQKTIFTKKDFDERQVNLPGLRSRLEEAVPHGGPGLKGSWKTKRDVPQFIRNMWNMIDIPVTEVFEMNPGLEGDIHPSQQLGTLGGGNHFLEISIDNTPNENIWIVVHSGSRGFGNRVGSYFTKLAKEAMKRREIKLSDADLAYFVKSNDPGFKRYISAATIATKYAWLNRECMMQSAIDSLAAIMCYDPKIVKSTDMDSAVHCIHNFFDYDETSNNTTIMTRKGATRAALGQLAFIPGSMGAKSFIVRGKGNPDSYSSCSHGAGRAMSRTAAKATFTVEDHERDTSGVECRKDFDMIDETPKAYKNIDDVMKAQADLVDIVCELKALVCVKG
jgi:tRNA-splicing ligase RtcB